MMTPEAQKEADIEFFDETKKACTAKNEEWVVRKKLREAEVADMKRIMMPPTLIILRL